MKKCGAGGDTGWRLSDEEAAGTQGREAERPRPLYQADRGQRTMTALQMTVSAMFLAR